MTGREGAMHTARMRAAGTNVVAGVSPGKGGQSLDGVRVFDSVAMRSTEWRPMSPCNSCRRASPETL